jgi:uncharacterized protein
MSQVSPEHEKSVQTGPIRTCAGCGRKAAPSEMVRLAVGDEHPYFAPDLAGTLPGRGVWVEPSRACIERAARRGGFSRALRREVRVSAEDIAKMIAHAYERRLSGLLASARRVRALTLGTDASIEALERGDAKVVLFAHDAAGRRDEIERLAKKIDCDVLVHGDKAGLGTLLGRAEVGVVTITDARLAHAVTGTVVRSAALSEVG